MTHSIDDVYAPGTPVTIGDKIDAVIVALQIDAGWNVTYHVAWWNGNTRETQWLISDEITAAKESATTIGFKAPPPQTKSIIS
jgi:hypothetical protein